MTVLLTVGKRPSAYDDHIHTVGKKEKVIVKWEIIDALCKEINNGNTNKYIEQVTCSQSLSFATIWLVEEMEALGTKVDTG